MTSIAAYLLGLITVIIIIIPFWFMATINDGIGEFYRKTIGYQVCNV
jgi:hypothetical protein